MGYQWQRFLYWANQNSSAIQAAGALVMCFVTLVLVVITAWYARLTRNLLNINRRQLAALFQPTLSFSTTGWIRKQGDEPTIVVVSATIKNVGQYPVQIQSIGLEREGEIQGVRIPANLILSPQDEYKTGHIHSALPLPGNARDGNFVYDASVIIVCSDLMDIARHQFMYSPKDGVRHEREDIKQSIVQSLRVPICEGFRFMPPS